MNEHRPDITPDWLRSLQQRSWEPEILLSGIVIYGMFQVPKVLDRFLFYFQSNIDNVTNGVDILVAILKMGVYWLIIGLILHLICRGLWIGLVGLSYSFPRGIRPDRLRYQQKYQNRVLRIPDFQSIVMRLEHICSTVFSVSFLLFMSLLGVYLYFLLLFYAPLLVLFLIDNSVIYGENAQKNMGIYLYVLLGVGAVGVLDFLTLGYFRRFKWYAFGFWPLYKVFSHVTLARYFRPTYYALVTNLNRWWIFGFLIFFSFTSFFGITSFQGSTPGDFFSRIYLWSDRQGEEAYEGHYQDKEAVPSVQVQIPSDIIRDDVLRVFIPARIQYQDSLDKFMNYDSVLNITDESFDRGKYMLQQIASFYRLTLADSTFQTQMYFQNNRRTDQRGYLTFLNIGYLPEGLYELEVSGPEHMYEDRFAVVPFYKLKD
ncbi:MAG: hypothetical protein AAGA85_14525 [Bacteroidota bacterium]